MMCDQCVAEATITGKTWMWEMAAPVITYEWQCPKCSAKGQELHLADVSDDVFLSLTKPVPNPNDT